MPAEWQRWFQIDRGRGLILRQAAGAMNVAPSGDRLEWPEGRAVTMIPGSYDPLEVIPRSLIVIAELAGAADQPGPDNSSLTDDQPVPSCARTFP